MDTVKKIKSIYLLDLNTTALPSNLKDIINSYKYPLLILHCIVPGEEKL